MYCIDRAEPQDIDWIAQIESEAYSQEDAIPKSILKEWYVKNPNGFSILKDDHGGNVGHIDILPLHPGPLQRFIAGTIKERNIRAEDLYSDSEKPLVRSLYIESVAILPPPGRSTAPALKRLLSEFPSLVGRIGEPDKLEKIYAVAATGEGEHLLSSLGFEIYLNASGRPDGHHLFASDFKDLQRRLLVLCKSRKPLAC